MSEPTSDVDALSEADWRQLAARASIEVYQEHIARIRRESTLSMAVAVACDREGSADFTEAALIAAVRSFPALRLRVAQHGPREPQLQTHGERLERLVWRGAATANLDPAETALWCELLKNDPYPAADDADVEAVAKRVLDATACHSMLRHADLSDIGDWAVRNAGLLRAMACVAPTTLVDRIHHCVRHQKLDASNLPSLGWTLRVTVRQLHNQVVAVAGVVLASDTYSELRTTLAIERVPDPIVERMERMCELHLALSRSGRYANGLASHGVSILVNRIASEHPEDWSDYLRIGLWHASADQALIQPTLSCALTTGRTSQVLREIAASAAPEVRDRARALLSLVEGHEPEQPSRSALIRLVEILDGPDAYPYPLRHASSIWLGSLDMEAFLRSRIDSATTRLARELSGSLGRNEEKLTTRILATISHAFADADVLASETTGTGRRLAITCEYRELSRTQEKQDGADIGWLLDVDVPLVIRFRQAEFVQAKKAARKKGKYLQEWTVETKQLRTLLERSQTAVYWLYGPDGTIHVVPARLVRAVLEGENRAHYAHARICRTHIRSMSIPIAQFLVDLFTGAWLGSSSDTALRAAQGEDPNDKPDFAFVLKVRSRREG